MRKESKNRTVKVNTTTINGYHSYYNGDVPRACDFEGGSRYFTSDRHVSLESVEIPKAFSTEWEMTSRLTNNGTILATILKAELERLFPINFFKYERDCTVHIEVVSQCATKEFWRNHYAEMKSAYAYLETIQTYPNAYGNGCGMHVNISVGLFGKDAQTQKKNIMKLHNFINNDANHYKFACDLFHRDRTRTSYCGKMTPNRMPTDNDHSKCMNYSHLEEGMASRVEIRLVGAQQTFGNWRNTMEVIFHLVKKCKELSEKDFENPKKLWKGCNKYVYDRLKSIGNDVKLDNETMAYIYDNMDAIEYI